MPIERAVVIAKMRKAFRVGQSASSFITKMKAEGLSYRKTTMLADWRNVNEIEEKKDRFKYVRKDRLPTQRVIAEVDWRISKEYMYVVKVKSRAAPDEPVVEQNINIMQDRVLTPREVEALSWEMISEQSPKEIAKIVSVEPMTVVRRVE